MLLLALVPLGYSLEPTLQTRGLKPQHRGQTWPVFPKLNWMLMVAWSHIKRIIWIYLLSLYHISKVETQISIIRLGFSSTTKEKIKPLLCEGDSTRALHTLKYIECPVNSVCTCGRVFKIFKEAFIKFILYYYLVSVAAMSD